MLEELNPLDWTAGPFLTLYVAVAGTVLLLVAADRSRLGGPGPGDVDGLGVLHLAYLAGGAERAGSAALVALLEAGAALADPRGKVLHFDPSMPVAREFVAFRHVAGGTAGRRAFQAEFAPRWDRLRRELAARGLLPGEAEAAGFRRRSLVWLCVPLLLGVCKVAVGASRDRPVGILVVLLAITGVLGAVLLARPHCNRAGAAALAAAKQDNARAARAPLPEEVALAFALSGAEVLSGRSYAWALAQGSSSSDGDSGSNDGGGDGGGGCGGCSG